MTPLQAVTSRWEMEKGNMMRYNDPGAGALLVPGAAKGCGKAGKPVHKGRDTEKTGMFHSTRG